MEYIIMAGGQATRWRNYNNTTKHLIKIGNENLLERIVRQLKENGIYNISITANKSEYKLPGIKYNEMIYENKVYNMFYFKSLNQPVTFLYGDTFYSDNTIKDIVNSNGKNILFFGTKDSIVGIKVFDYQKFKKYVELLKDYNGGQVGWMIYRKINNITINDVNHDNFLLVKDNVFNINSPEDYEKLLLFLAK